MLTTQDLQQIKLLFKEEREELKTVMATKKDLGKLRKDLKLFTRFFDKQISDLRKDVAALKTN